MIPPFQSPSILEAGMATEMGKVASLWRYPMKSMSGEELAEAELTEYGLLGDRAYALIDVTEGKAATAKNPGQVADAVRLPRHFRGPTEKRFATSGSPHDIA